MSLVCSAETIESLVGFKITQAVIDVDESSGFFGFKAKKGKKEIAVWILRDEEGKGAGCLDVRDL